MKFKMSVKNIALYAFLSFFCAFCFFLVTSHAQSQNTQSIVRLPLECGQEGVLRARFKRPIEGVARYEWRNKLGHILLRGDNQTVLHLLTAFKWQAEDRRLDQMGLW